MERKILVDQTLFTRSLELNGYHWASLRLQQRFLFTLLLVLNLCRHLGAGSHTHTHTEIWGGSGWNSLFQYVSQMTFSSHDGMKVKEKTFISYTTHSIGMKKRGRLECFLLTTSVPVRTTLNKALIYLMPPRSQERGPGVSSCG